MTIKIEKGIPAPEYTTPRQKYPFTQMDVGDSFFAPVPAVKLNNASARHKHLGKKFTIRAVTENGVAGARCWRVG